MFSVHLVTMKTLNLLDPKTMSSIYSGQGGKMAKPAPIIIPT